MVVTALRESANMHMVEIHEIRFCLIESNTTVNPEKIITENKENQNKNGLRIYTRSHHMDAAWRTGGASTDATRRDGARQGTKRHGVRALRQARPRAHNP